jgi:hypothetical protein
LVRQGLQKDARPNGFKRLLEFTKSWASLRFVLTGNLNSNAESSVSQNKKAFFRPCLTKKTSEAKNGAKFPRWGNFASSKPTGLVRVKRYVPLKILHLYLYFLKALNLVWQYGNILSIELTR